ncbi:DNA primase [Candidatus Giovannonibacteria bacterium]|nr:DNA primase [Candidatus Giovannonibacteria bacterium]
MASPVEDIKARLSVVDVVGSYIRLVKSGANFKAVCPFHKEKTPSFYVSPSREIWHCFGCGAGGDIFRFVMQIEGVEFPEALELLASRAGVVLKRSDPKLLTQRKRSLDLMESAQKYFSGNLNKYPDVRDYLIKRGLKEETISSYSLGYAEKSWEGVLNYLNSKGFRDEEIEKAGLAIISQAPSSERRKFYDRFRGRIMFPIADGAGRTVGFSGRIFGEGADDEAKYINTPQTMLYDKSRVLYLWDRAKGEIRKEDACIIVEGQMDALMSHQAGIKNVIAVSGTALGQGHLQLIKRLTSRLLLAFDTDEAGGLATKRGVDLALKESFSVNIIEIEHGKDPADLIKDNSEAWVAAVKKAVPVISFFLSSLQKKFSSNPLEYKSKVSALVLPYVKAVQNEIEKAHWVAEIAKSLGIKEEPVWSEVKKIQIKTEDYPETFSEIKKIKNRRDLLEEQIIGIIFWKKGASISTNISEMIEFFSFPRRELLKAAFGVEDAKPETCTELDKLALEAELLYGEMEHLDKEFAILMEGLKKEELKAKLEALAVDIKKFEALKDSAKLERALEEFKVLSKNLNK